MALQVPFHGFFSSCRSALSALIIPQSPRCGVESWTCTRAHAAMCGGIPGSPNSSPSPSPRTRDKHMVLPSSKDRPRQKWKQPLGACLVGYFVSLKYLHKVGQWVPYEEFIQKGALTSLCLFSSIWKAEIARFSGISPHCHLPAFPFLSSTSITAQCLYFSSQLSWTGRRIKLRALVANFKVKNCICLPISCSDQPQASTGEWSRKPGGSCSPVPSCLDKRDPVPCGCLHEPQYPFFMSLPPVSPAERGATAQC